MLGIVSAGTSLPWLQAAIESGQVSLSPPELTDVLVGPVAVPAMRMTATRGARLADGLGYRPARSADVMIFEDRGRWRVRCVTIAPGQGQTKQPDQTTVQPSAAAASHPSGVAPDRA